MEATQEISDEVLRRICGHFQEKYGLAMDSLTAALLNEVREKDQRDAQNQQALIKEIMTQINSLKPFTTDNPRASFAYGFGKYAWAWTAVIFFGIGLMMHHTRETMRAEYQQAKMVLERYPNLPLLEPLIKSAKIVKKDQGDFLELAPAKDRLLLGKTYTVDPTKRLPENATKVLIPLKFK
ncbi:hypothetical protein [Persicitalea sp.]|uniref:hypothetical protein n=1 Tax=Persicitalea sp. TaxID=3100273 RepID=UPI003593A1A8